MHKIKDKVKQIYSFRSLSRSEYNTIYEQRMNNTSEHYNEEFFKWQSSIGEFGGWAHLSKYEKYISKTDTVLDFGCGGGYLLKNLNCEKKLGVEVNQSASEVARKNGIDVFSDAKQIPDNFIDVIISDNALEHIAKPYEELLTLYRKLKKGGKIIFVVPCESIGYSYKPNDINHHLYSWSPMCIGNLFTEAGFKVIESKAYIHKWPPMYRLLAKILGRRLFDIVSYIVGQLRRSWFQVRIIAEK